MDKTKILTYTIIAIAVIIFGVILYAIFAKKITKTHSSGGGTTSGGIGNFIISLFGGSGGTGGTGGGWLSGLFGGGGGNGSGGGNGVNCVNGCDQNKSGYDCDGFPDSSNCGFGRFGR